MKLMWVCHIIPGIIQERLNGSGNGALWVEHVLSDIRQREEITLRVLAPGPEASGRIDEHLSYSLFPEPKMYVYQPGLEERFVKELEQFQPEVIHIWGAECAHSLAMVNAAQRAGMSDRTVINIQGLSGIYVRHFCEGLPARVCRRFSFRDLLRWDNVAQQRRKYESRGRLEKEALEKTAHIMGRTDWDKAITAQYRPDRIYHFCNETLRACFYEGSWRYQRCKKHRIFTSSFLYPVKGFHYLLEAFTIVLKQYPDATISVPGDSFFPPNLERRLRQQYYHHYLERYCLDHGLADKLEFLGDDRTAEQMKQAFLEANVFVMPSTVENSPNSLGEAMLLGVPCVAADVGGIANLLSPGEGYVYQSTAPYMLAYYIMEVFRQEERAEELGRRARSHALRTHDPRQNLEALLTTYRQIAGEEGTE